MKVTIDRFEGSFAVVELEDRTMANIPSVLLPTAKEGDVINITIDLKETQARKKKLKKMLDDLLAD